MKVESSSSAEGLEVGYEISREISAKSKVFGPCLKFNRLCEFEF